MSVATYDLETSTTVSYGRKANPFDPNNKIVAAGWAFNPNARYSDGCLYDNKIGVEKAYPDWFKDLLHDKKTGKDRKYLIGQNIKFDLLYSLREEHSYKAWQQWVVNGGKIWDTMTAEFLIEGMTQEHQFVKMEELARRYGGNAKVDEVKTLWDNGVPTEDIDKDLLLRYLNGEGDQLGDIGNTVLFAREQMKRVRDEGNIQLASIQLNMAALVGTTEMERNGLYCDVRLGYEIAAELREKIDAVEKELFQYINHIPPEVDFTWTSHQISAVIFGGNLKYKLNEFVYEDGVQQFSKMKIDEPILDADGNLQYYKTGKKAGQVKTKQVDVPDPSKPKTKINEYLFHCEGLVKPDPKWETKNEGVYQTNADVIAELDAKYDIPFINLLQKRATWTKDLSTYFISEDSKGNEKGMLTLVYPDGLIHPNINNVGTVTGRFSSSKPNMQNIPRKDKSDAKKLFRSRFKDGSIIQSDFSSLEIYMMAVLVKPKEMIRLLNEGTDIHVYNLAYKLGESYEETFAQAKGHKKNPIYEALRTEVKEISFKLSYGAGLASIAAALGKSVDEVREFVNLYYEMYPEINPFFDSLGEHLEKTAYSLGRFSAHPDYLSVTCDYKRAHYRTPDGKKYTWDQTASPSFIVEKLGKFSTFMVPEIKNYCIQGLGAEWAKAAVAVAVKEFYRRENFGGRALLINQVHDAMYVDAAPEVVEEAAALLHVCMEKANDYMEKYLGMDLPVRVPTETGWGSSMAEENDPTDGFWVHVERFRKEVVV